MYVVKLSHGFQIWDEEEAPFVEKELKIRAHCDDEGGEIVNQIARTSLTCDKISGMMDVQAMAL